MPIDEFLREDNKGPVAKLHRIIDGVIEKGSIINLDYRNIGDVCKLIKDDKEVQEGSHKEELLNLIRKYHTDYTHVHKKKCTTSHPISWIFSVCPPKTKDYIIEKLSKEHPKTAKLLEKNYDTKFIPGNTRTPIVVYHK